MKKIITTALIFITCHSYSQDYHYKFKLDNVSNLGDAKMATNELRHLFDVFPTFNDSTDYFDFISGSTVEQSTLQNAIAPAGYVILEYYRTLITDTEGGVSNE